jgi:hypothetical protein
VWTRPYWGVFVERYQVGIQEENAFREYLERPGHPPVTSYSELLEAYEVFMQGQGERE